MDKEKLLLIDGHSILSRAFYGIPELNNSKGLHTNGVFGFLNILFRVLEDENADHLAVVFDRKEPTFRHKMFEGYKGTRKPMPSELLVQIPLMQEVLKTMNIPVLTMAGYEADDILGTIAKREQSNDCEVCIISGDRDLLQLADKHIKIKIPRTLKGGTEVSDYYPEDVLKEWEVTPKEFIDLKALMGDASDNIPGVPGIGVKTATKIIKEFHSIEEAHNNLESLKPPRARKNLEEYWEQAKLSKVLATIDIDVPIEFNYADAHLNDIFNEESFEMIKNLEFKTFYKKFNDVEMEVSDQLSIDELKESNDPYMMKIAFKDAISQGAAGFSIFLGDDGARLYFSLKDGRNYLFYGFDFSKELSDLGEKTNLYTMNLKRQLYILPLKETKGINDLSLMAYLINPLKDSYDFEDIARDYLNESLPSKEELKDEKNIWPFTAIVSIKAYENVLKELEKLGEYNLYRDIEMPLIYTLFYMEKAGVKVDRNILISYGEELDLEISEIEKKIYEFAGEEFNINSPKQLGVILFEKLSLPGAKKTKTGYSTAASVLEGLKDKHEIIDLVLKYRTLSKLNSTYAKGLMDYIEDDGRIHGVFNQMVTATGRISSTEPNLQNIPIRTELGRKFRKVFVPKDEYVFIDADYSQVELRILAALSNDLKLVNAYKNAEDIHKVTASLVFHVPLQDVSSELRSRAKAVNFGIVYGISAFGLSEGLGISRKEAGEYIKNYFSTYPDVKNYLDSEVEYAKKHGFVKTYFGRIRPIPEINSSNFMRRSFGERVAMNSPIQGTAADIMKIAMNRVDRRLKDENLDAKIVLQVHDELLIEARKDIASKVKDILVMEMQGACDLSVRLRADAKIGESWYEAH